MAEPSLEQQIVRAMPTAPVRPVSPARPRHVRALRRAHAVAEALFSTDATPAPAERISWLLAELDIVLTCAGWRSGGFYKLGLLAVTILAPLLILRPVPLHRLSIVDRVRALRKMEHSFAASVVLGVKAILCVVYYEHPDAALETGYTPGRHRVTP
ncbi:MAG: hypothetical protein WBV82_15700 [Myxococcaceae bacterium]